MKLVYLAQIGVLDNWAHTVQIMKMCEAFSKNNIEVVLLVPKRKSTLTVDPHEMYNVEKNFKIVQVPYIDIFQGTTSRFFYWIRFLSFLFSARSYLSINKYDVLYTREILACSLFNNSCVELHSFPKKIKYLQKYSLRKVKGIIVLTSFIKNKIMEIGIESQKILISADAVSLQDFKSIKTIDEARDILKLEKTDFIFGYLGTLKTMGMEKGVSTAIDSLKFLDDNFKLYVVGGEISDIDYYKKYAQDKNLGDRVIFAGKVSLVDRPLHTSVCNVMVAPFPVNEHYSFYMSPLKIFEYMASKRPIVVTDLPSLREVLKEEETALFVPPNDPEALAKAVNRLKVDNFLAQKMVLNGYSEVVNVYNWNKRAGDILNLIKR